MPSGEASNSDDADEEPSKALNIPLPSSEPKLPLAAPETAQLHPSMKSSPTIPSATSDRQLGSVQQFRRFRSPPQRDNSNTTMSGAASNSDDADEEPSKARPRKKQNTTGSNEPETAQLHPSMKSALIIPSPAISDYQSGSFQPFPRTRYRPKRAKSNTMMSGVVSISTGKRSHEDVDKETPTLPPLPRASCPRFPLAASTARASRTLKPSNPYGPLKSSKPDYNDLFKLPPLERDPYAPLDYYKPTCYDPSKLPEPKRSPYRPLVSYEPKYYDRSKASLYVPSGYKPATQHRSTAHLRRMHHGSQQHRSTICPQCSHSTHQATSRHDQQLRILISIRSWLTHRNPRLCHRRQL